MFFKKSELWQSVVPLAFIVWTKAVETQIRPYKHRCVCVKWFRYTLHKHSFLMLLLFWYYLLCWLVLRLRTWMIGVTGERASSIFPSIPVAAWNGHNWSVSQQEIRHLPLLAHAHISSCKPTQAPIVVPFELWGRATAICLEREAGNPHKNCTETWRRWRLISSAVVSLS